MGTSAFRFTQRRTTLAVIVFSVLATLVATTEQRPPLRVQPASYAVDLAATIDESPTTVGMADSNLMRLDDEGLIRKQLDMMQAMGVQNVRVGISWFSSQPLANSQFNWTKTDFVIEEANRRGMGVLGVLHETPIWAGSPPLSGMPDPDQFAAFAGAVAQQYKGKVSALEVWNEPNGRFFLNPASPAGYTAMLRAAYTAIKAADLSITVVGGVLGSGRTLGNDFTVNPIDFLTGMYAAGAHGYFDAFSFHPYHYDIPFSQGETQSDSPILQLRAIRALMDLNGDGDLKVWASEYGVPTSPLDPARPWLYNSPEKQAQFIQDFLENWQKEAGTGPVFIYSTRDINTGSPSDQDNFGVYYTDWTAKPAVKVITDFIADLAPDHPWVDAIRNIISGIVDITGAVIAGIVDLVVNVAEVIINAAVWVVDTIVDVTSRVVHGIADAIVNSVNWVVEKVKSCLGIGSSAPPAQNRMMSAATALTVEDVAKEEDELPASDRSAEPEAVESTTAAEVDVVEPDLGQPEPVEADVAELDVTEAVEPVLTEPETTVPEPTEAPASPADDEVTEAPEAEPEPAEEAEEAPVTPRATTTTTQTVRTVKGPKTAASGGLK